MESKFTEKKNCFIMGNVHIMTLTDAVCFRIPSFKNNVLKNGIPKLLLTITEIKTNSHKLKHFLCTVFIA